MEDSVLSKELIEAFRPIVEMNNVRFRQVKTMLAGFIATQERDLNYMDEYMDVLFDFMDPESDTEMLKPLLRSTENSKSTASTISYSSLRRKRKQVHLHQNKVHTYPNKRAIRDVGWLALCSGERGQR